MLEQGHAAFELAMHEDDLWPWLHAQKKPQGPPKLLVAMAVGAVLALGLSRIKSLAFVISTIALSLATVAYLGLMQQEGGLIDSCLGYQFVEVTPARCVEIGARVVSAGQLENGWLTAVISKARAENCFALGMGIGALYALLCLAKGTKQVCAAAWTCAVATCEPAACRALTRVASPRRLRWCT